MTGSGFPSAAQQKILRRAAETTGSNSAFRTAVAGLMFTTALAMTSVPAFALSELQPAQNAQQAQAQQSPENQQAPEEMPLETPLEGLRLPEPGPAIDRGAPATTAQPAPLPEAPPAQPDPAHQSDPSAQPGPSLPLDPDQQAGEEPYGPMEIVHDMDTLPAAVMDMRKKLVEAAASGDIERLRPLLADTTQVMNGEFEDPIETLKNFSGDPDGQEILAILIDILATGAAHFDSGTPDEAYVWPYFTGKPVLTLTPPERVDLLRIVTAGDLAGMEENGNYSFFRIGIAPDGKWKFFSGGD